jgi:hypothetical protein
MKNTIGWLFIIIGIFAFISGCGYFFAIHHNGGAIYFGEEIPAITQVLLSVLAIVYGIKMTQESK